MKPNLNRKPRMNTIEIEYSWILEAAKRDKQIIEYRFEALRFRLADNTTYTPDFMVITSDAFEFHEVKGPYVREDAWIKFKMAVELYPWLIWKWCQKTKDKGWEVKER